MAITNNALTNDTRGAVGRTIVFRRRKSGKMIMAKRPGRRTTPPTAPQMEVQERFKESTTYAKSAMNDAATRALYKAAARDELSAYNVALRDAFKSPKVKSIDTTEYFGKPGNIILVRAVDDFKVASVRIAIRNAEGILIEEGPASMQSNSLDWQYTTTIGVETMAGVSVLAIAKDLPGNTGKLEIKL